MLVLEQTFTRCDAGGTVSIWQVPMTRRDILRETAMLLVQPVPGFNGLVVLHTGSAVPLIACAVTACSAITYQHV